MTGVIACLRWQRYGDLGRWAKIMQTFDWSFCDTCNNLRQNANDTAESCRKVLPLVPRLYQRASPRPLWCRLLVVWIPKEGASLQLVFCRGGLFRFALSQQSLIWSFSPKSINNAFFVVMGILQIDVTGDNPLPHISNNLSLRLSKLLSLRGCPLSKDIVERVHLIMKNSHRSGSIGFTLRP